MSPTAASLTSASASAPSLWGDRDRGRAVNNVNEEIRQWAIKYGSHCAEGGHLSVECLRNKAADAAKDLTNLETFPPQEAPTVPLNATKISAAVKALTLAGPPPEEKDRGTDTTAVPPPDGATSASKEDLPRLEYRNEDQAAR